jgi:hypothetical protein
MGWTIWGLNPGRENVISLLKNKGRNLFLLSGDEKQGVRRA